MKMTGILAFLSLALCCASTARAVTIDTFGSDPNNTFDIEFLTIGNAGNAADTDDGDGFQPGIQNFGSVASTYRIGKFEISEDMINKANAETAGDPDPLNLTHDNRGANKPATSISWFEAARFVNWLNTSTNSTPAYKFDGGGNFQLWQSGDAGYDSNNLYRNRLARYFLPSVHEWYKAAYYDPNSGVYYDYPTGSDSVPDGIGFVGDPTFDAVFNDGNDVILLPNDISNAGLLSPYGTMGQGGNVWEWEETDYDLVNNSAFSARGIRGGFWNSDADNLSSSYRVQDDPPFVDNARGFRVASIPEPSTLLLGALAAVGMLIGRRR